MFETLDDSLGMIGIYASVGFCLAVVYNILRFFRLAFPRFRKTSAVCDFLFAILAGFILFAYSVPYGSGFFRLYYVIAAAFGFALNMITFGFAVPPLSRFIGKITGKVISVIIITIKKPINFICEKTTYFFIKVKKYMSKIAEKRKTHLNYDRRMMYNNYDHKIGKVYSKGGENRNAIKAKVRKII